MEEDNTQYYCDEWNQSKKITYEQLDLKYIQKYNKEEIQQYLKDWEEELRKEEFNNKNNKPDGRRYKK